METHTGGDVLLDVRDALLEEGLELVSGGYLLVQLDLTRPGTGSEAPGDNRSRLANTWV